MRTLLVKVLDSEAVVDVVADALEVVDVVVQPIVISESSAGVVVEQVMAVGSVEPRPLHTEAASVALPQLLLMAELLLMAALVAMVEEATATHQAVVGNLGGRLPLVGASLFLFRYIFDSGTIHRFGTKASTDIDRLSVDTNLIFVSDLRGFHNLLNNCFFSSSFLRRFRFSGGGTYTLKAGSQPSAFTGPA